MQTLSTPDGLFSTPTLTLAHSAHLCIFRPCTTLSSAVRRAQRGPTDGRGSQAARQPAAATTAVPVALSLAESLLIAIMVSWPATTSPKIVYEPSRCGAGETTTEKWPEFESGPEFAAESSPARSCLRKVR